jgi:hypothetical protein
MSQLESLWLDLMLAVDGGALDSGPFRCDTVVELLCMHGQKTMRVYGGDVVASCLVAQRSHAAYTRYSATGGHWAAIAF